MDGRRQRKDLRADALIEERVTPLVKKQIPVLLIMGLTKKYFFVRQAAF
ncbi:hypothetical protein [Niabella aurantiaca]